MRPLQTVGHHILRCGIDDGIVPTAVLKYDGVDLTLIIRNPKRAVIELHGDLLMAPVDVDVGVGGHLQLHAHTLFDDHETGSEHFFSVVVRVINRELIGIRSA